MIIRFRAHSGVHRLGRIHQNPVVPSFSPLTVAQHILHGCISEKMFEEIQTLLRAVLIVIVVWLSQIWRALLTQSSDGIIPRPKEYSQRLIQLYIYIYIIIYCKYQQGTSHKRCAGWLLGWTNVVWLIECVLDLGCKTTFFFAWSSLSVGCFKSSFFGWLWHVVKSPF